MTQDEKVLIFRHPRGVTTDLLDVEIGCTMSDIQKKIMEVTQN